MRDKQSRKVPSKGWQTQEKGRIGRKFRRRQKGHLDEIFMIRVKLLRRDPPSFFDKKYDEKNASRKNAILRLAFFLRWEFYCRSYFVF